MVLATRGGSALLGLLFAPIIWSRKQIAMATLASGTAVFFIMQRWVRLGVGADGHAARMARHQHWAIISSHLVLFIAGGIPVLALAIADYMKERSANSLLLLLWIGGTFWFTAFLNWTMNARSVLPMIPALAILLARRLETLAGKRARALKLSVASAWLVSGTASLWLASADSAISKFGAYRRISDSRKDLWRWRSLVHRTFWLTWRYFKCGLATACLTSMVPERISLCPSIVTRARTHLIGVLAFTTLIGS